MRETDMYQFSAEDIANVYDNAQNENWIRDRISERVTLGATWLDMVAPWWIHSVSAPKLDITSGLHCVRGQVYGSYFDGPDMEWLDNVLHGFNHNSLEGWDQLRKAHKVPTLWVAPSITEEAELLREYWIRAIKARKAN